MNHWRYKSLYWSYETKKWEWKLKKQPKKYACKVLRCLNDADVERSPSGKLRVLSICNKCKRRRWRVNNPLHHMFAELKRSAKRRGIYFDIHQGEFIEFCFSNNFYRDSFKFTKESLTVDRIDPNLGYTICNLRVISQHENTIKGNQERKKHARFRDYSDDPF